MEAGEAVRACTSGCPSVTGPCATPGKNKEAECDADAHWELKNGDGGLEGGAAFGVYSSETVSPGSHFGSDASQQAMTFRYYAQLS